jgi:hypothetical protein
MKLIINKEAVQREDITKLAKYQEGWCNPSYMSWNKESGHTEYKLYSFLSYNIPWDSTILDIGTLFGGSALALSNNSTQEVLSYDLVKTLAHDNLKKDNIKLFIEDWTQNSYNWENIHLIIIDVEPHDGTLEPPMIQFAVDHGFEGLIVLDDISGMFPGMTEMWGKLPYEKYNVTEIGHFSGTGILNIGHKFQLDFVFGE